MTTTVLPTVTSRRKFLTGAAVAGTAAVAMPQVSRAQTATLKMQGSWGAKDVFNEMAQDYIERVNGMAGGRLKIDFLVGGSVVHPFQVLDGVHNGVIENYQILTPSTWMASPKDPFGNPGPYEEAVHATPILENFEKPEDYKGIDILRTIRSFDPCMPCTTHIHTENRVISRDVVTCACGVDDEHEH